MKSSLIAVVLACVAGARKQMGVRKNARERRRHARGEGVPLPRARPFFLASIYFLAPATQSTVMFPTFFDCY